jgi:hypothetical protein
MLFSSLSSIPGRLCASVFIESLQIPWFEVCLVYDSKLMYYSAYSISYYVENGPWTVKLDITMSLVCYFDSQHDIET